MAVAPEQMAGLYPDESTHTLEAPDSPPMAKPPDWATYIPTETLDALKNQDAADNYGMKAQGQIADLYGAYAEWQTQQAVQAVAPQWGEPSPTEDSTQQGPSQAQAPDGAGAPDINPVTAEPTTNPVVSQFLDGLGGLLDKMRPGIGQAASGVQDAFEHPENAVGGAISGAEDALLGQSPITDQERQDVKSGFNQAAGDYLSSQGQQRDQALADISSDDPNRNASGTVGTLAAGVTGPKGDIVGPAEAAGREALTAAHPIVKQAADLVGVSAQKVADALASDSLLAKFARTKNPERDLTNPAQRAAYAVFKLGADAPAMAALPAETKAAVAQAASLPPDISQGATRAAMKELPNAAATSQTTTGKVYRPSQATIDSFKPPAEGPAPDLSSNFSPGAPPNAAATARTTSGSVYRPSAATVASLPGGLPTQATSALLRHGLSVGGAVGGEILGLQTTDDQDAGYLRVLKALPYAAAGAAGGSLAAHLGNPDMAQAAGQTFRGGLLSPRVGVAKATADANSILNAGAIRGAQAALAGDSAASATKQAIATYYGEAKALPEAASAFWDAIKGAGRNIEGVAEQKPNDLGNIASTASQRTIEAITEATRVLLEKGSQYADAAVHPQFGDAAARATDANSRLFLGPSEGWMGEAMMNILKPVQKIPGIGGLSAPFTTVPSNLLDRMASATPGLGALNLVKRGVPPLEVALRQAKGVLATGAVLNLFGNNIHGAGPQDPETKAMLPPGWQSWAVELGGHWIGMHKLPPEAQAYLRAAATVSDMQRYGKGTDLSQALYTVGSAVKDSVIFPGIVQLLTNATAGLTEGASQRERALANSIASMSTELIPWYMRQAAQSERGTIPETSGKSALPAKAQAADIVGQDVSAHVRAQLPGSPEQSVPASLTTTGQPLQNPNQGVGAFANPFSPSQPQNDPVLREFSKVGQPILPVRSTITTTTGKSVQLSGEQDRELNQLRGQYLSDKMPAGGFRDAVKARDFLTKADEFANKQLERAHPELKQEAVKTKAAQAATAAIRATTVQSGWGNWGTGEQPASVPSSRVPVAAGAPAGGWGGWGK